MQDAFIYYSLLGKPRNHDEMAYKSRRGYRDPLGPTRWAESKPNIVQSIIASITVLGLGSYNPKMRIMR